MLYLILPLLGITIWHESRPPTENKPVSLNNTGWFFLFPDMEVMLGDEVKRGVAVCLSYGTVVSWDARIVRHCTSVPDMKLLKNGKVASHTHGTYFGYDSRVANHLEKTNVDRRMTAGGVHSCKKRKNK